MKRVTAKGLQKLNSEELKTLLWDKSREKEYFLKLDRRFKNRYSGKLNTLDNQLSLIRQEVNNRRYLSL